MASTNQGPRRIGQWLYLRPECIDEYKKCHAAVWPEVLEQIKDSNVRDCMYIDPLSFVLHLHAPYPQHTPKISCQTTPMYMVCIEALLPSLFS